MKKSIVLFFLFTAYIGKCQDASVAKNIYGVQIGLFNCSFFSEIKLQRKIVLYTEIGMDENFRLQEDGRWKMI